MNTPQLQLFFDKIYCINLPERTDRLKQFENNYAILGTGEVTVFKAVNGKELNDPDWLYNKGALGCRLSHLGVYKEALEKGYNKILVFEDDVKLQPGFRQGFAALNKYVHGDWDMIYFGGYHHLLPEDIGSGFIRLKNTLALHAVALNARCLPKLIDKIEKDKRWVDSVIADLHPELKVYGFKKPFALQNAGYSDILEKEVDYRESFRSKVKDYLKNSVVAKMIINKTRK